MPRTLLAWVAALLACATPAAAQSVGYSAINSEKTISWTSASALTCGSASDVGCIATFTAQLTSVYVDVAATGSPAFTAGRVVIEGDDDHNVWARTFGEIPLAHLGDTGATNAEYHYGPFNTNGLTSVRVRLAAAIVGAGTVTVKIRAMAGGDNSRVTPLTTTRILTTSVLGSGAVFTSPWFDTMIDGTTIVYAHVFATTIGSAANGFAVQGTDDTTNANMVQTLGGAATVVASTYTTNAAPITTRFYRIIYTNGAGTQGAFELSVRVGSVAPPTFDPLGVAVVDMLQVTSPTFQVISQPTTAAAGSLTSTAKAAVTTGVNVVTGAHNLYGFSGLMTATAGCWVQFIDSATGGTLGTAVVYQYPLPTSAPFYINPANVAIGTFTNGIAVGIASAINGASACATAAGVVASYK